MRQVLALTLLPLLAACGGSSAPSYGQFLTGQVARAMPATVVSARPAEVTEAGVRSYFRPYVETYGLEEDGQAIEYVLRLADGRTVTVVDSAEAELIPPPGAPVVLQPRWPSRVIPVPPGSLDVEAVVVPANPSLYDPARGVLIGRP